MLSQIPDLQNLIDLLGENLYNVWVSLCEVIEKNYDMDKLWNKGGKVWNYEYKYRRSGKTLCSLYAKENCIGFMIIFGKEEREKFEKERMNYSQSIQITYDEAKTYHDGKWVMYEPVDNSLFEDFIKLLEIKRKPNRK